MHRILCLTLLAGLAAGQPRTLLSDDDIARIRENAERFSWAAALRDGIVKAAEGFPQDHLRKYGLSTLALPAEGGQWYHHYVCPTHGVRLVFGSPSTHRCPVDGKTFTGWPYDQVILSQRHDDLAGAARDLALAWRLTGRSEFARQAAWILSEYAGRYQGYALHDTQNKTAKSGGRAHAQTLDESIWLIPMAWAYDLLTGYEGLDAAARTTIENGVLRAAVETVGRNDAGISNWQSWHNAGMGAVGFALADQKIIDSVIDGKSGIRFQFEKSIEGEGFWYEGAWGYHFYALNALVQLAEMAARNGIDLYGNEKFRGMFSAPLSLAFADGSLPAFNDSASLSLFAQDSLYEVAYARWQDPAFASVLGRRARSRNALFWGAAELPASDPARPGSQVFLDSGFATLRAPAAGSDHAVIVKFGPHGGGHGHYDKLNFVSFWNGGGLAVDPGTQSYAAPTHGSWDKTTVAHNTLIVDEQVQREATGQLEWSSSTDEYAAVRVSAGQAYATTRLVRTMFVTAEYALDIASAGSSDGKAHTFDWVYHNEGGVKTELPLEDGFTGFGKTNGYQHLTNNRAAAASGDWQLTFDGTPKAQNFGSVYASVAAVSGTLQVSAEQVYTGRMAARASYRFSGSGYLLYTIPVQVETLPAGVSLMVLGDASGNKLSIRVNDSTDERFVTTVGPIDWTGWRKIELPEPARWTSHYLGNNDGVIDLPIRSVSLELGAVNGAATTGTLYVDEVQFGYGKETGWRTVADFEIPYRSLRVWMLGDTGTTVVTGDGLGPNLLVPVPYVLARRRGESALFVTLLEPHSEAPRVGEFRRTADGAFVIAGPDYQDTLEIGPEGVVRYERRRD